LYFRGFWRKKCIKYGGDVSHARLAQRKEVRRYETRPVVLFIKETITFGDMGTEHLYLWGGIIGRKATAVGGWTRKWTMRNRQIGE